MPWRVSFTQFLIGFHDVTRTSGFNYFHYFLQRLVHSLFETRIAAIAIYCAIVLPLIVLKSGGLAFSTNRFLDEIRNALFRIQIVVLLFALLFALALEHMLRHQRYGVREVVDLFFQLRFICHLILSLI